MRILTARWALLLAATLVATTVTACGSDTPAPVAAPASQQPPAVTATATALDPCALVTVAELSAALGGATMTAGAVTRDGLPGQQTCPFNQNDGTLLVTIGIVPGGAATYSTLAAGLGSHAKKVSGLGTDAVRDNGYLNVLAGDYVLLVFVSGLDNDSAYEKATVALARAALGRL